MFLQENQQLTEDSKESARREDPGPRGRHTLRSLRAGHTAPPSGPEQDGAMIFGNQCGKGRPFAAFFLSEASQSVQSARAGEDFMRVWVLPGVLGPLGGARMGSRRRAAGDGVVWPLFPQTVKGGRRLPDTPDLSLGSGGCTREKGDHLDLSRAAQRGRAGPRTK